MNQPVFAYVEITGAGAAFPIIRSTPGNRFLEPVETRVVRLLQLFNGEINIPLRLPERPQLPLVIVNDPDRGSEAQFERSPADRQRIIRIMNPAAQHRVDIDVKIRVLRK